MAGATMRLKLLVDSRGNQVVLGEASNDLVDFLFSLLRLPLATVIRLLKSDANNIGSIANIYRSIENLEDAYMESSESRSAVLKPRGHNDAATAKHSSASWRTRPLYTCAGGHWYVTHNKCVDCPKCPPGSIFSCPPKEGTMSRAMKYVGPSPTGSASSSSSSKTGSYVQSLATYMVTDELSLSPMSVVCGISLLKEYNLQLGDLQEKVVEFEVDHLELDFLDCSLKSKTVLTDIFLEKELHLHSHKNPKTGKTVSLKLLIHAIHQKVIFAEAGKDFVDFLCSLLLFPVGTVIRRLAGDTPRRDMVGCIGNIYSSLQDLDERYMQHSESKDELLMPDEWNCPTKIPLLLLSNDDSAGAGALYTCSNYYFHVMFDQSSCLHYFSDVLGTVCPTCSNPMKQQLMFFLGHETDENNKATNVEGGYVVRGVTTYTVTDDLCITPLSLISAISTLSLRLSAQQPVDLQTRVVQFGMSQGLKLLKASLQSKTALTDVYCEGA